jgi:hypothetical protein
VQVSRPIDFRHAALIVQIVETAETQAKTCAGISAVSMMKTSAA